jgi:hypothetical protein
MARRMLTAFQANQLANPEGKILAVEETLQGELLPGLPPLLGRVDLIVETPKELVISDGLVEQSFSFPRYRYMNGCTYNPEGATNGR